MNSWFSFVFTGLVAATLSLTVSGCRFGNQVKQAEKPWDGYSGFYETQIKTHTLCAEYIPATNPEGGVVPKCIPAPLDQVPQSYKAVMTNPIKFMIDADIPTIGGIFPYNATGAKEDPGMILKVKSLSGKTFTVTDEASGPISSDPLCTAFYAFQGDAILLPTATPEQKTFDATGSFLLRGSLNLSIGEGFAFEGTCTPKLQTYADCLKNDPDCTDADRRDAEVFFRSYLDAEVFGLDDIPTVQVVYRTVDYQ